MSKVVALGIADEPKTLSHRCRGWFLRYFSQKFIPEAQDNGTHGLVHHLGLLCS